MLESYSVDVDLIMMIIMIEDDIEIWSVVARLVLVSKVVGVKEDKYWQREVQRRHNKGSATVVTFILAALGGAVEVV